MIHFKKAAIGNVVSENRGVMSVHCNRWISTGKLLWQSMTNFLLTIIEFHETEDRGLLVWVFSELWVFSY